MPGTVIVVPAGVPHRFVDVDDELVLAVVFAAVLGSLSGRGHSTGGTGRSACLDVHRGFGGCDTGA
jgi:hypothetical protein